MNRPYTITKKMWKRFQKVLESDIFLHPVVEYFNYGAWEEAFEHFEVNENQEDLLIV